MCFRNKLAEALKSKSSRSPHRRRYREPMKPRLPRRVVPGAKVNLNAYWSQFEELSVQSSPALLTFDLQGILDWSAATSYPSYEGNEVNDNLINELMELGNK